MTSSLSEKVAVSEGHRNVLRLLYQLCPDAALKSPPAQRKVCDFEGLFASTDPAPVLEGTPTLFHRVAELREEHQARFRAAAEAGKAVASALPSRRKDRGCCSDPALASSATMNPVIPRLVGALSNRRSLSFSFEEAAGVESLCNGMLASQSSGFCFFSALLHWLKQLGFEAPDPSLFGQLVQEVSGSLVTAANSASALAAFMLAKRREGVLSHFPPHVGSHFKKDLAFSFSGPHVFDDEVLARVMRRLLVGRPPLPRVLLHLLPPPRVFGGGGGGGGRGLDSGGSKRKASSPGCSRSKKSPRLGFSPASKQGRGRKLSQGPCPAVIGSCLSLQWCAWRERGAEPWVVEVLKEGYAIPFHMQPPLSPTSIVLDSYSPQSVKGRALEEEIQALRRKGAEEPAPPTPGFYSRMFVVTKAMGGWRPIIDLSTLNLSVDRTPFRMESSQMVLRSVRRND